MKHWWVYTPEYGTMIPLLDDGTGPMEYGRDVVCADGRTKREAIVAGVRKLRDTHPNGWLADCDGNPFVGIKAELAICPHGHVMCDCERCTTESCEECERISEVPA